MAFLVVALKNPILPVDVKYTGVFFTDYTPDENPTVTDIGWFHRLLVFMKSTFKITELGASPTWVDRVRIPR